MASIFRRKEKTHPNDLMVEFKQTGVDGSGNTVYAEVLALEPGSIGGGGAGSAVTIVDGGDVAQDTTTDLSSASTVVGILKAIKAAVQGTLTTSVSNFPATQPVSLATNTPDVTDRAARLLGHVTVDNASLAVTGTFFQATQPVSLAAAVDVSDRAARLLGIVDKGKIWDGTNIATVKAGVIAAVGDNPLVVTLHPSSSPTAAQPVTGTFFQATQPVSLAAAVDVSDRAARLVGRARLTDDTNLSTIKAASTLAAAADTALVVQHSPHRADASTLAVTATAAVNTAVTLTLPAAGAGLFHYITSIQIVKLYAVVGVAAGAGVLITTTNLPGSPVWTTEQLASPAGTAPVVVNVAPATPLKSSVANTATTIVAPLQLQTIWRINVTYYAAP